MDLKILVVISICKRIVDRFEEKTLMNSIYLLNKNIGNEYYATAKAALIDLCSELNKPKQHNHELLILTCYVNLELVKEFVRSMNKCVKVSKVSILFDFSEVYRIGPKNVNIQIQSISKYLDYKGICFEYAYLFSSSLVHSKGYAIVQKDGSGKIIDGVSLITSANFTNPGFLGENVELGQASNGKKIVKEFIETFVFLKERFGKTSLKREIFKQEEYLFRYALLESGVFLHKWTGNLKQDLSIVYNLTESTQRNIKNGVPFDLDVNSFSLGKKLMRQIIDVDSLPEKIIPRSFITSYTIETFWGRWCPREAWNYLICLVNPKVNEEDNTKFGLFLNKFKEKTSDVVLESKKKEAQPIQDDLQRNGHIIPVQTNHLDKWVEKVSQIRDEGNDRLKRYFLGYENSDLPYTVEQKESVNKLFNNLKESMAISRTENRIREKVKNAIDHYDLKFLDLDEEDAEFIKSMVNISTRRR